uniref:Uncharacterized protein n=1 Tax=Globodera rostochiensis TaxID=31243 RepID=A0A914H4H0_GLORO
MDGTSNSNYAPGHGMDGTSNSNYGNKSKSIVVYDEQNQNELFVLFKGFVQIRKIKDGKETLRSAKKNEVFVEIFCGDHVHDRHISTDKYGKFEVIMHASDVKENFEKCEQGLNIGFYKYDPNSIQNISIISAISWQEKAEDDDENSFQISFKSNYAVINGKKSEILGDKAQYRSYAIYTQMKHSAQSESSSSENQLVKMYKKVTTCFGKK